MPRLSDDLNDRLRGIVVLVRLYRKYPSFEEELNDACKPYHSTFQQLALEYLGSHRDAINLQDNDYQSLISNLKKKAGGQAINAAQIKACFHSLSELAYQWKLTVPMSGLYLFLSKVTDEIESLGIKFKIGPSFHAHLSADIPPLKLGTVPAWLMTEIGKTELLELIGASISEYADNLKKHGLRERPSKLEKHTEWWFKHHILGKKYDNIAQEETYSSGGSLISYAKNVGEAVRKFSRLIGIKQKI